MLALERQKCILQRINDKGVAHVGDLSRELNVTEETIRRDMAKLEVQGLLVKTYGGAIPSSGSATDFSLEKRKRLNSESKKKIAKRTVDFISEGDTVFLDASTTTFALAKEIKSIKNITVITNSLLTVNELIGHDGIKVIGTGGFAGTNRSFVGNIAEECILKNYFADKVFFSSKGITHDGGILESNEYECGIKRAMIKNSRVKYYLCDKEKIGGSGYLKLADFDEIDYLITDGKFDKKFKKIIDENKIKTIII